MLVVYGIAVSADLSTQLAGWDDVRHTLDEIRACQGEFDSFFSGVFDHLQSLSGDLSQHKSHWVTQRHQQATSMVEQSQSVAQQSDDRWERLLEETRSQHAEMCDAQKVVRQQVERLAAIAAELAEAHRQDAERGRSGHDSASHDSASEELLRQLLDEFRQQQQQWRELHEQAASNTTEAFGQELAEVRRELAAAQQALLERFEQLQAAQAKATGKPAAASAIDTELRKRLDEIHRLQLEWSQSAPAAAADDDPLRQQLQEMTTQQAALDQERASLEIELESVRGRAAELAESLADEKRQTRRHQEEFAEELKRMRGLLELMSYRISETAPAPATPVQATPTTAGAAAGTTADNGADPVLDSVMAQFEMLQRDLARRRNTKG